MCCYKMSNAMGECVASTICRTIPLILTSHRFGAVIEEDYFEMILRQAFGNVRTV